MRKCILFPFVSGGESGATRTTRMDNHPGNPLEKHNSKKNRRNEYRPGHVFGYFLPTAHQDLHTLLGRRHVQYVYSFEFRSSRLCEGISKDEFEIVGIRRVLVFLSFQRWIKPSHSLRPSAGLFYLHKSNRIWETALSGKHKTTTDFSVIVGKRTGRVGNVRERAS